MTDLSPTAQAVLDTFTEDNSLHDWKHNHYNTDALAAALRAAADQVVPACSALSESGTKQLLIRHELLAIAAELRGKQ